MIHTAADLSSSSFCKHSVRLALGGLLTTLLFAPATPAQQEAQDPEEGSRYAHVRLVEGEASLVRAFDGDTVPLDLNLPVIAGDRLTTDEQALLELGLADGSMLRARGPLTLDLHALSAAGETSDSLTHLELHRGELSLRVTGMEQSPDKAFQVDAPSGTAYLMTDGLYRFSVDDSGSAVVMVHAGVAEISGDGSSTLVRSGQASRLVAGRAPTRPGQQWASTDDFDRWVDGRDQLMAAAQPPDAEDLPEAVRPYTDDLAEYGTWRTVPTYGTVWFPSGTPTGWYPYYYGYWVGSPVGQFWVSYEPWGWVPYHYGRWEYLAGRGWFWIPGPVFAGAWVHWWAGPTYVSWVPLGYSNRPVVSISFGLSHHRTPYAGWACVPYRQFYSRDLPHKYLRDANTMKAHMDQAVPVRRLPGFHPRQLRSGENVGADIVAKAQRSRDDLPRRRFHAAGVNSQTTSVLRRDSARTPGKTRVRPATVFQVRPHRGTAAPYTRLTTDTQRSRGPGAVDGNATGSPLSGRGPSRQEPKSSESQGRGSSDRSVTDLLRRITRTPQRLNAPPYSRGIPARPVSVTPQSTPGPAAEPRGGRAPGSGKPQMQNTPRRPPDKGRSGASARPRSGGKGSGNKPSSPKSRQSGKPKSRGR